MGYFSNLKFHLFECTSDNIWLEGTIDGYIDADIQYWLAGASNPAKWEMSWDSLVIESNAPSNARLNNNNRQFDHKIHIEQWPMCGGGGDGDGEGGGGGGGGSMCLSFLDEICILGIYILVVVVNSSSSSGTMRHQLSRAIMHYFPFRK